MPRCASSRLRLRDPFHRMSRRHVMTKQSADRRDRNRNRGTRIVLGATFAALAGETAQGQVVEIPQLVIYATQAATEAAKVGSAVTVLTDQEIKQKGFPT